MNDLTPPSEQAANVVLMSRFLPDGAAAHAQAEKPKPVVSATPFKWTDPRKIPPREWVYGYHYIRQFVSTTVAPGGVGKSSLSVVEALAMATGRPLLGITPNERTRVWLWNGEDPLIDLQRRVGAVMEHYDIRPDEVEGWLFLDSGRTSEIVLASQTKSGAELAIPVIDALENTIRENRIGVVILDPFVSVHRVSENDNGQIDMVAKAIARIADRTNCAFDLIHHVRKTNGGEVTVEDGRGAVALLSAARAARAINQMTRDEADKWGIENPRLHFRYYDGKANLAPPSETSTWFKLESFDLGNATAERPSDRVGVVTRWEPPNPFDDVTTDQMLEVRRRVSEGKWRESSQSREWIGYLVAEIMKLNPGEKADKAKVNAILKTWFKNGVLKVVTGKDDKGNNRPFVAPGEMQG
jgi:hypothetical protein